MLLLSQFCSRPLSVALTELADITNQWELPMLHSLSQADASSSAIIENNGNQLSEGSDNNQGRVTSAANNGLGTTLLPVAGRQGNIS